MRNVAIRAVNLSKSYRIGANIASRQGYKTLQEDLVKFLRNPFRSRGGSEPFWALRDISFEVQHGEVLGIIGRNGAGKSTLLKVLSRITKPTSGYADVYGRIGSLLEVGTGFHPELTGRENIFLNGAILGMRRAEIQRRFDEIVDFAEIEQFLETPVKRYSSGMYMRLAFAVAAHLDPEILVVDEVLAVGDAKFQEKCLGKMREVASGGRTVLFVSHNMAAILGLCTRALLIDKGGIALDDSAANAVNRYVNDSTDVSSEVLFDLALPSRFETSPLRFRQLRLLNRENEVADYVDIAEGVTVEITYEVRRTIRFPQVGFLVWNQDGICVLTALDTDVIETIEDRVLNPGLYTVRCHIPGSLLRLGRYWIDLGSSIPNIEMFDEVKQAISFEVIGSAAAESKLSQTRLGVVAPRLDWVTLSYDAAIQTTPSLESRS
ncbi:MAG: ABC transporter ATP-binding protein [Chloroflexi bacterium]|nr:ABC transporter ATP-binding protein [Chloroflexota bacterium]